MPNFVKLTLAATPQRDARVLHVNADHIVRVESFEYLTPNTSTTATSVDLVGGDTLYAVEPLEYILQAASGKKPTPQVDEMSPEIYQSTRAFINSLNCDGVVDASFMSIRHSVKCAVDCYIQMTYDDSNSTES